MALHYRDNASATRTLALEIGAPSAPRSLTVRADVADPEQVRHMVDDVVITFGGIDVLVCAAGVHKDALRVTSSLQDWDYLVGVNLRGSHLCARATLRAMVRAGSCWCPR